MPTDGKISNDVAYSTALSVINRHRTAQLNKPQQQQQKTGNPNVNDNNYNSNAPTSGGSSSIAVTGNTGDPLRTATNTTTTARTPGSPAHIILPSNHHQHNNLRERLTHDPGMHGGFIGLYLCDAVTT